MTKKIFRSILLAAVSVLLASLVIIMGCLYDYYKNVQEKQLRDELRLASSYNKFQVNKFSISRFRDARDTIAVGQQGQVL